MIRLTIFLLTFISLNAQPVLEYTTKSARDSFLLNLRTKTITENFSFPLNTENEKKWHTAFWGAQLINFDNVEIEKQFEISLEHFFDCSTEFQRAMLEALYQYKGRDFSNQVFPLLSKIKNEKNFAMAANYLLSRDFDSNEVKSILENNFQNYLENPILYSLLMQIELPKESELIYRPSIESILDSQFPTSGIVIYSFQRSNRDFHGITIIKNNDNEFLKNEDGSIFYVEHLARSISNLPSYLTNGNTPQGVFSIQETAISKNYFIGPTENLQLVLPFEVEPSNFFNFNELDTVSWSGELYSNLFPKEWENYFYFWEAYYAGKAGRNEIIAHGTTVDPNFYKGASYYPNAPTLGCISAKEIWDLETGARKNSDQQKFIDMVKSTGKVEGFFVVIEIDNKNEDVKIEEILTFIDNLKKD